MLYRSQATTELQFNTSLTDLNHIPLKDPGHSQITIEIKSHTKGYTNQLTVSLIRSTMILTLAS